MMELEKRSNGAIVDLGAALKAMCLPWDELKQRADQIVLFGSRSVGLERVDSDWDLLVVGQGQSHLTHQIDLVWVPSDRLHSREWLSSELAHHIGKYGIWLLGRDNWRGDLLNSTEAFHRKLTQIDHEAAIAERHWRRLSPSYRKRNLDAIRRDLQRLAILSHGGVVPPTPVLDESWNKLNHNWSSIEVEAEAGLADKPGLAARIRRLLKSLDFH